MKGCLLDAIIWKCGRAQYDIDERTLPIDSRLRLQHVLTAEVKHYDGYLAALQ